MKQSSKGLLFVALASLPWSSAGIGIASHQDWKEQRSRASRSDETGTSAAAFAAAVKPSAVGVDCTGPRETLAGFRAREEAEGHAEGERLRIFPAEPGVPRRGAALVVHGLNLRPSRMDTIARLLSARGYDVVRAALAGHGGNLQAYREVTRERFLSDMRFAVCHAKGLAEPPGETRGPLVFVGYSLGALVMQDLVNSPLFTASPFSAQVLLAPAIAVKPFTHAVRALTLFPRLVLPSFSLEGYRASSGTTLAAYRALFDSRAALLETRMERSNVPTLVLASPDDELVSLDGLREVVRRKGLSAWTVEAVDKAGHRHPRRVNHLIVDEESFSAVEWERVRARILGALP